MIPLEAIEAAAKAIHRHDVKVGIRAALQAYIDKHQGPATNPRLDQHTQTRGK